jgi:hypothetical protein
MGIVESEGGGLLGVEAREFAMGCATVVCVCGAGVLCYAMLWCQCDQIGV